MNIDLNTNNYTIEKLELFLKLNQPYDTEDVNNQIAKMILKVLTHSNYDDETKQSIVLFLYNIKDKLYTEYKNNYASTIEDYTYNPNLNKGTAVGQIISDINYSSHNPLQYQQISTETIYAYQNKSQHSNYVFNTRFRQNFLNTIPQTAEFVLPQPIKNVVSLSLKSIQFPNVMFTFSNSKFTTQLYIKENVTNFEAIVRIPSGNYDETTLPFILEKSINEQVVNPLIDSNNYRFHVTIDPYTFFVTIRNDFYEFTMETITDYPSSLGKCNEYDNIVNLSSTALTIYETIDEEFNYIEEQDITTEVVDIIKFNINYNTKYVVSDLNIEESIFKVNKLYTNINSDNEMDDLFITYYSLNSIFKGSLVLTHEISSFIDNKLDTDFDCLYVPLQNQTVTTNNGNERLYNSVDKTDDNIYTHRAFMLANILDAQSSPVSKFTNKDGENNRTRTHEYTMKIYRDNSFEIIQNLNGQFTASNSYYKDITLYDNMEYWNEHNVQNSSISYNPFFHFQESTTGDDYIEQLNRQDTNVDNSTYESSTGNQVVFKFQNEGNPAFFISGPDEDYIKFIFEKRTERIRLNGKISENTWISFDDRDGDTVGENDYIIKSDNHLIQSDVSFGDVTNIKDGTRYAIDFETGDWNSKVLVIWDSNWGNSSGYYSQSYDFFDVYGYVPGYEDKNFSIYDNVNITHFISTYQYNIQETLYSKQYTMHQMMTNKIYVTHDPDNNFLLNIAIDITHNPNTPLNMFPNATTNSSSNEDVYNEDVYIDNEISNDQFIVNNIKQCPQDKTFNLSSQYNFRFHDKDLKRHVDATNITSTLGYQIGFRNLRYNGQKEYTSEGTFDKSSLDYVYFCMNDFNNTYLNHTIGVLPNENILDSNILGVIPLRSSQFTTTFDNGSDYINKQRLYSQPVDIKKIKIRLIDPIGNLLDIHSSDITFVLEINTLLDNT